MQDDFKNRKVKKKLCSFFTPLIKKRYKIKENLLSKYFFTTNI